MIPAPNLPDEADRLASLERMKLLATPREADFDRVTRLAQRIFGVEIALISILDAKEQWFKARLGLDVCETPRDISFCGHAIQGDDMMVINDATKDERFIGNPLVTGGPEIRFYAGQPLTNGDGHRIGTLCVVSPHVREISDIERQALRDLGRLAELVLEARTLGDSQRSLLDDLRTAERKVLIDPLSGLWNRAGINALLYREMARSARERIPLAVAIVGIDHFKRINDTFGHPKGDEAIQITAEVLTRYARSYDIVGRYGGEEFLLVLPGVDLDGLPSIGEKILRAFLADAKLPLNDDEVYGFTVSVGLSSAQPEIRGELPGYTLLAAADKALYKAKMGGRARYEIGGIT